MLIVSGILLLIAWLLLLRRGAWLLLPIQGVNILINRMRGKMSVISLPGKSLSNVPDIDTTDWQSGGDQ